MDEQVFRAEVAAEGYGDPYIVEGPPAPKNEPHAHEFDVRFLILEGVLELEIDGVVHRYCPGDAAHLPAGTIHTEYRPGDPINRGLYARRAV